MVALHCPLNNAALRYASVRRGFQGRQGTVKCETKWGLCWSAHSPCALTSAVLIDRFRAPINPVIVSNYSHIPLCCSLERSDWTSFTHGRLVLCLWSEWWATLSARVQSDFLSSREGCNSVGLLAAVCSLLVAAFNVPVVVHGNSIVHMKWWYWNNAGALDAPLACETARKKERRNTPLKKGK